MGKSRFCWFVYFSVLASTVCTPFKAFSLELPVTFEEWGRLGLYGPGEHRSADDLEISAVQFLTQSGYAAGTSNRYNGTNSDLGTSAWYSDLATGTSVQIGLSGSTYTRADGYRSSRVTAISESGWLGGTTKRYQQGGAELGERAWLYHSSKGTTQELWRMDSDPGTAGQLRNSSVELISTGGFALVKNELLGANARVEMHIYNSVSGQFIRPGLSDTKYSGYHATVSGLTEQNYAFGHSNWSNGTNIFNGTAWVADLTSNTYRAFEFDDPVHMSDSGEHRTGVLGVRKSGMVYGAARRFDSTDPSRVSQSLWVGNIHSDDKYIVGLYEDDYKHSTGAIVNALTLELPQSDRYLVGGASRFNGGDTFLGQTPWIADSTTGITRRAGLTGHEHTSATGLQHSYWTDVNEDGYVVGFAHRYNGKTAQHGRSAWVTDFHGNATHFLGFRDAAHTGADDFKHSLVMELNESGYARGFSFRYDGQAEQTGRSAWIQNVKTLEITRVGLVDGVHTSASGFNFSNAQRFTESGFVAGFSQRFGTDNAQVGQTAWLYNLHDQTYERFELAVNPNTQFAYSEVRSLSEDGVAYGHFAEVSTGEHLGDRAFVWSEATGVIQLTEEMDQAVNAYGWENLRTYSRHNDMGYIVGLGDFLLLNPDSRGVFVVLMIPEPSRAILVFAAVACVMLRRRRSGS